MRSRPFDNVMVNLLHAIRVVGSASHLGFLPTSCIYSILRHQPSQIHISRAFSEIQKRKWKKEKKKKRKKVTWRNELCCAIQRLVLAGEMPNPLYAFTLPSIDDDTPLACRIYHPKNLRLEIPDSQADLRGAVIAHPYAPLGGSYDDAVVLSVTETLVNEGHIVMTFNFR